MGSLDDDFFLWLERRQRDRHERVVDLIRSEGREDLIIDLEQKMREIANGVDQARSAWHSISVAQKRALAALDGRRCLRPSPASRSRYDATGGPEDAIGRVCGIDTIKALCIHGLVVRDPDSERVRFILTERGRFVLEHGRPQDESPNSSGTQTDPDGGEHG